MSAVPIDPNDPRLGIPPTKFGAHFLPLDQPGGRVAVMMILFPPVELRDAPYPVIEAAIFANAASLLSTIAKEIHKGYTSEPLEPSGVQNMMTALQGHLDAQRGGK